jgi:hypothetical protein
LIGAAARSSSAAAGPSSPPGKWLVSGRLPQMLTAKNVFIAPSGKKPVPRLCHARSGTSASRRLSIAAVASWIAAP